MGGCMHGITRSREDARRAKDEEKRRGSDTHPSLELVQKVYSPGLATSSVPYATNAKSETGVRGMYWKSAARSSQRSASGAGSRKQEAGSRKQEAGSRSSRSKLNWAGRSEHVEQSTQPALAQKQASPSPQTHEIQHQKRAAQR
eukprot:2564328-Rhodomonas_salina.2